MGKKQRQDLIAASFTLILGILELVFSTGIVVKAKNGDVGSAFMPQVVGILMVVLSLTYGYLTICTIRKNKLAGPVEEETASQEEGENTTRVYLTFALLVFYAAALKPLGFVLTSMLYLFLQINVMADRPKIRDRIIFLVIAVIAPILINMLFVNVFSMMLPQGLWH